MCINFEELNLHDDIKKRLTSYIEQNKVPHLIFHGPSGSGKRTLVNWFLSQIYKNINSPSSEYIMYVDCAHGKGIKFIREQVKFFVKTNLCISKTTPFKSIILSNADRLTTDAQSALRRLIEVFSHNTRFFIIVEDKYSMLMPILSRLGDVYIPLPIINKKETNLNKLKVDNIVESIYKSKHRKLNDIIHKHLGANKENKSLITITNTAEECYENAFSALDIIEYLSKKIDEKSRSKILLIFEKIQKEYRNEILIITTLLYYGLVRCNVDIDNIGFM